jgi:RNA polymerase sigma-70 factor (ECF subfamily)
MKDRELIDNRHDAPGIDGPRLGPACLALSDLRKPPILFTFTSEYVQKLTDGDPKVESHFVEYFSALLTAKLRFHLRSGQEVQEFQQEVFLRVLRSLRQGSGLQKPDRLGAFVNTVCTNVLLEHFRHKSRMVQFDQHLPEPKDPRTDLESTLVAEENDNRVRSVVAELSVKDQRILKALFFEEREKDSICREFGVTRSHLRVLLHRAGQRFRRLTALRETASVGL